MRSLDRAYSPGHHGRWSARRRAALADRFVCELFDDARAEAAQRLALVALGGYGRGELAPASDIDLLILHSGRDATDVRRVAERIFYPLWDAGFTLGNAVRTIRECMTLAAERLDAATALLDARLLAGEEGLFTSMHDRVVQGVRRNATGFVTRLRDGARERHDRAGSVSHLLEPDLKEGSGGLRDIQTLRWIAWAVAGTGDLRGMESAPPAVMRASERVAVEQAEEYFTRLRSAMHLEAGKKVDRVLVDAQPSLARLLGFEDEPHLPAVDALMRATFEHARTVEHVTASLWGRVLPGSRAPRIREVDETPEGIMALFAEAAASGLEVDAPSLDRIEQVQMPEEITWTPGLRRDLLTILRAGTRGSGALETLDRSGLLVRFLPEWSAVRCRPQRDPYHRYTVDVHLLETVAAAAELAAAPPGDDPVAVGAARALSPEGFDGLLLGALFHDIGKTGRGGHVAVGTELVAGALERMGVEHPAGQLARFLVEHHLLLSDTATRRDLEDEDLVLDVASRVGDPERLAALYLLTVADAGATGPHAWTPWRATLVRELTAKVQHVLERGTMGAEAATRLERNAGALRDTLRGEPPEEIERFLSRMPRAYLLAVSPERAARHFRLIGSPVSAVEVRTLAEPGSRPGTHELTVVARDRPRLLARIAGSLALSGLSILTAQVFTTEDDVAIDLFEVEGAFAGEVDEERWRRFRSTLRRAVEGRLSLEYRVREKRAYYKVAHPEVPIRVTVDSDASDFFTVIEVGAADRMGLLFDITRTLADLELDVHFAKVATYGGRVVDAFYVRDVVGQKVGDEEHVREIERAITAALAD